MIVIDASIVLKFINTQEEGSGNAAEILRNHIAGTDEIIVPSLLFIEVANALVTKSKIKEVRIVEGLELLYAASFKVYEIQESEIQEASILANKYKTTVYDMIYAVIAKKKNIKLVTADRKFVNKVKFPFVQSL